MTGVHTRLKVVVPPSLSLLITYIFMCYEQYRQIRFSRIYHIFCKVTYFSFFCRLRTFYNFPSLYPCTNANPSSFYAPGHISKSGLKYITRATLDGWNRGVSFGGQRISILKFVKDITLCAQWSRSERTARNVTNEIRNAVWSLT